MGKRRATVHNHRDTNEPAILAVLAQLSVAWIEAGPLDGWVYIGEWIPVEIKMPGAALEPGQVEFIQACIELARPYAVLYTTGQAVQWALDRRAIAQGRARYGVNLPASNHVNAAMAAMVASKGKLR